MQLLEVDGIEDISDGTYILRTHRPTAHVRAGQCFSVGIPELAINREYSIFSAAQDPMLEFLIREVPGGSVSTGLRKVAAGSRLYIGGPYGEFCLDEEKLSSSEYVFIATGTGIAPFRSYIKTYPSITYSMHHGVRFEQDLLPDHVFPANDRYFHYISRPNTTDLPSRRVTDGLREISLHENQLFYLCGNRMMITDAVATLKNRGVPGSRIFMETFF